MRKINEARVKKKEKNRPPTKEVRWTNLRGELFRDTECGHVFRDRVDVEMHL